MEPSQKARHGGLTGGHCSTSSANDWLASQGAGPAPGGARRGPGSVHALCAAVAGAHALVAAHVAAIHMVACRHANIQPLWPLFWYAINQIIGVHLGLDKRQNILVHRPQDSLISPVLS